MNPSSHPRALFWIPAFLSMAVCTGNAGNWSVVPWKSDKDLPKVTPEQTTHAIAFGIDMDPPAPAPFVITNKTSGENWSVWKAPEHNQEIAVSRRPDEITQTKSVSAKGESAALIRGRILSKGKSGWLTLELTGLQPGVKYKLDIFGLVLFTNKPAQIKATASDAPDKPEFLDQKKGYGAQYYQYEYTAPPGGDLSVTFAGDEADPDTRLIRMCAFLNARAE